MKKVGYVIASLSLVVFSAVLLTFIVSGKKTETKITSGKEFSVSEIAKHSNSTSCWTVIRGNVYDLTKWIDLHPGGSENILSICGNDGTEAFNYQHQGQGRPEAELATFLIGKKKN